MGNRDPQISGPAALNVVAQNDPRSFVSAESAQPSQLHQLASSLGQFGGDLQGYLDAKRQKDDQHSNSMAQADFYKKNMVGFDEGVKKGLIPANQSPAYVKAYKNLEGDTLGSKMEADFTAAYQVWPERENASPAEFHDFFAKFASGYIKTNDPLVLDGLMPRFHATALKLSAQHDQVVAQTFQRNAEIAQGSAVAANIDLETTKGVSGVNARDHQDEGVGIDYDGMWTNATAQRKIAVARGMDGDAFDKQMFNTFAAKAIEHKDYHLLEMLDKNIPGTKTKFSDTAEGLKLKMQTSDALTTIAVQQERDANTKQAAADKKQYNESLGMVLGVLTGDPNTPVPEDLVKQMEKQDPEIRVKLPGWRRTLAEGSTAVENPKVLNAIYTDLINGGGHARVLQALEHGEITNPKTLSELTAFSDKYDASGGKQTFDSAMSTTPAKDIMGMIKARTSSQKTLASPFPDAAGLTDSGMEAKIDFSNQVGKWIAENPKATQQEVAKAVAEIGQGVVNHIQPADPLSDTKVPAYQPDRAAQVNDAAAGSLDANAFRPTSADVSGGMPVPPSNVSPQEQQQRATQAELDKVPALPKNWDGDAPPVLTTLSPALQERINKNAAETGNPPELILQQMWQTNKDLNKMKAKANPNGVPKAADPLAAGDVTGSIDQAKEPVATHGGAPTPEERSAKGSHLLDLIEQDTAVGGMGFGADKTGGFTNDPERSISNLPNRLADRKGQVTALLDSIGAKEAPRGYGQVYGGARVARGTDVSQMTINQILAMQRQMVASGSKSTAVGRYQFLRKTLAQTVAEMGLNGSETWTPDLQDRMAVHLMEHRGLNAYLDGKITPEQFANNLSMEWASLPVVDGPKKGRSYYAGDGLNHSFHTPQEMLALVKGLKSQTANSNKA